MTYSTRDRLRVEFRCPGCDQAVNQLFTYEPKASYAVVADAAASWVQDKHGSSNAAMKCDGISAGNAVS